MFSQLGLAFQPTENDREVRKCLLNKMELVVAIISGITVILIFLALAIGLMVSIQRKQNSSIIKNPVSHLSTPFALKYRGKYAHTFKSGKKT